MSLAKLVPVGAVIALAALPAQGQAPRDTHPPYTPPLFQPQVSEGIVTQVGEVVVMQGDDEIVSALGGADYGIDQMENIANRFYLHFPDEFDGLAIFTSFPDLLQGGAAYALILDSDTGGIGLGGGAAPQNFGSAGRLLSLVNMNDTGNYSSMTETDPGFYTTFGQEFGHTWLSFMEFVDPLSSQRSSELLGRDDSHWSAVFDAGGSVMDGLEYTDNGNGTFTAGGYGYQYGPLDLYAMGVYAPSEVGPMFLIRNAAFQNGGMAIDPVNDGWTGRIGEGTVITGERVDFTIDDVIAAEGPRTPAWDQDNEDFRVAFILVTKPGETADMVADRVAKLDVGRLTWERKHREWTLQRSTMCTDITALCPLAFADVDAPRVSEDPDQSDGDGVIEPGERVRVDVTFRNDGSQAATDAVATLSSASADVLVPEPETLPEIPIGGALDHTFYVRIEGGACGAELDLAVTTQILSRRWQASTTFRPGILDAVPEPFATEAGWAANNGGALQGGWEHGVPQATFFAGRTIQPDGGAGGAGDAAWLTGPFDRWDEGEVQGTAVLESAPFDMTGYIGPALRYKLWYFAYDRPGPTLVVSPETHLVVEISGDGGASWTQIDQVSGEPQRWIEREVPIGDALTSFGSDVRVRFVVTDDKGPDERLVEVGIDDVSMITLSGACAAGDGGGCCSVGSSRREAAGACVLGLLVLVLAARRRSRTVPTRA